MKTKKKHRFFGGDKVRLTYGGPIMTVMRVEQTMIKEPGGKTKVVVNGVKCCWTDEFGDEKKGMFHTRELVPV